MGDEATRVAATSAGTSDRYVGLYMAALTIEILSTRLVRDVGKVGELERCGGAVAAMALEEVMTLIQHLARARRDVKRPQRSCDLIVNGIGLT